MGVDGRVGDEPTVEEHLDARVRAGACRTGVDAGVDQRVTECPVRRPEPLRLVEHGVARVVEGDAIAEGTLGPRHAHTGDGGQVGQHAADQEVGRRGRRVGVERDGDVPDEVHGRRSAPLSGGPDAHDLDRELAARALVADGLAGARARAAPAPAATTWTAPRTPRCAPRWSRPGRSGVVVAFHPHLDDGAGSDDLARLALDDHGGAQDLLELADARLVVALLVLGRVVVGVLPDVAVLAGALDPGRDLLAARARTLGELLLEPVVGLLRQL